MDKEKMISALAFAISELCGMSEETFKLRTKDNRIKYRKFDLLQKLQLDSLPQEVKTIDITIEWT